MSKTILESQIAGVEFAVRSGKEADYAAFLAGYTDHEWRISPFEYALAWGKLMQVRIEAGEKLVDIARSTSHDADVYNGESGATHVAAVSFLVAFWAHGDELRVWHNAKHGIPASEKGVARIGAW